MRLSPIVAQLRKYATCFHNNVTAGLDFNPAKDSVNMRLPSAFVIFLSSSAEEAGSCNVVRQNIRDDFSVYVLISTRGDERGQSVADQLSEIRRQLFLALVGWSFDDYSPIQYEGGELAEMDRGTAVFRFDFWTDRGLGRNSAKDPAETWQEYYHDGLPPLKSMNVKVDCIDPADPMPGPDGKIDAQFNVEFE